MCKDWSNKLHKVWRENWVGNGGLEEMCYWYELLVAKSEGKLLEYSRICSGQGSQTTTIW